MIEPKPEVAATPPAHHGAFDYDELARLGYSPDEVIDFSVNSNPYGPPPGVQQAIARVPLDRYPDRECIALREVLAVRHHVNIEQIVVGNGTAELLMLIAMAFIRRGDKVLVVEPTFSEYERVARLNGAQVHKIVVDAPDLTLHADMLVLALMDHAPRCVFLCQPNNPTGQTLNATQIRNWVQLHQDTLCILDAAYLPFTFADDLLIPSLPNLIIIHSMTKNYALAGLRLGYAVGHRNVIEAIRAVRPAWNVNGLAQAAGVAALDQNKWLREAVNQLHTNKRELTAGLKSHGYEPLPSAVHYFLMHVGDGAAFRAKLLKHKIMVRDCASFGLPEYVRIAARTPEDNNRLLEAVAALPR